MSKKGFVQSFIVLTSVQIIFILFLMLLQIKIAKEDLKLQLLSIVLYSAINIINQSVFLIISKKELT
ncbi:MAG: hypothetical protein HYU67_02440 [Flavobacteriia bacterium]|nr:hypothetical protein [Flavobacteriia bacterium]